MGAAVPEGAGVDMAGSPREPGGAVGFDPLEVKVPTRLAVLAPSVGLADRSDFFVVDFPPAAIGGVDGGGGGIEVDPVIDAADGPSGGETEVCGSSGFAAGDENTGAGDVAELDGWPSLVSKPGFRSSLPSRISATPIDTSS